ncbi:MAG: hypothetical protein HY670_09925 [Chloroflexi bacterium]|nr:hypothetical protein [Chloroflexota bacterium]
MEEAEKQSELKVAEDSARSGLTEHFVRGIYNVVCREIFSGYGSFGEGAYGINQVSNGLYELSLVRVIIAYAGQKEILERCRQVHLSMIDHYLKPENSGELAHVVQLYPQLKEMELHIEGELEKLVLRRTFHGRCDICPD